MRQSNARLVLAALTALTVVVAQPSGAQQQPDDGRKGDETPRGIVPHRPPPAAVAPRHTPKAVMPAPAEPNNAGSPQAGKKTSPGDGAPKAAVKKTVKVVTPHGPRSHTVTASRFRGLPARGAGRVTIRGRNVSVWRDGYRVRHGHGWRTFVALGSLSAVAIGGRDFYPYAYVATPENYCDGLTEDLCQLVWQDVETMEGDVVPQCVAYCPWQ